MARQIVLVQPVHDQHDRPAVLVVQPAVERMVKPFVGALAVRVRQCLLGLERIVDDDNVRTAAGQHPADRGGDAAALCGGLEFGHRLPLRRQSRWEDLPVPVAGDDPTAIARQFVGELLGMADAEDLRARIAPQAPGRKGHRGQMRLRVWYKVHLRMRAGGRPQRAQPTLSVASGLSESDPYRQSARTLENDCWCGLPTFADPVATARSRGEGSRLPGPGDQRRARNPAGF